jgi:hypothetical protein
LRCDERTYRLLKSEVKGLLVDVDGLARDLICPSSIVPEAPNNKAQIDPGHSHRLASIEGLKRNEQLGLTLQDISELIQEIRALRGRLCTPFSVKCSARRSDGDVNIFLGCF